MERKDILAIYDAGPEAVVNVIEQLIDTIAKLEERIKSLENQLNKNSRNSSKPPSTDAYAKTKPTVKNRRQKSGKKAGGQKGHTGSTLRMVDNPDETVIHNVEQCSNCGISLKDEDTIDYEKRQIFDIPPITLKTIEHQSERKSCPNCGQINKAKFPDGITQPTQYSPYIRALAVYLHDYQLIPYERSCELLSDVCGCEISPATLIRAENECFGKLECFENESKTLLQQSHAINCDETGSRINGVRNWLHVASTDKLTYYFVHRKRGYEAMNDMNVLPDYNGVAVHDFWKPYYKYECKHSLCNAHLLRELLGVSDDKQQWTQKMDDLLLEIKKCVDETRDQSNCLGVKQIRHFEVMYNDITKMGLEENPPPLVVNAQPKKRGRKKQTKIKNLLDRFIEYKGDILRFMHDFEVPFDNNQAERDVRMTKVQQKISGTFRSTQGAESFCRIRGYISTAKKNMISVIDAIRDVFNGNPFVPELSIA